MKSKNFEVIAAIDIGSSYIKMVVSQLRGDGSIENFEKLTYPTDIGADTFSTGKISLETALKTCETLTTFKAIMKTYKVKKYKAVGTSGLREAQNREYVIDQIRSKTGLEVEVINTSQERMYVYKALKDGFKSLKAGERVLILNFGYGGMEMSYYEWDMIKFSEYIKLGSLRLHETLSVFEDSGLSYSELIQEYSKNRLSFLLSKIKGVEVDHIIAIGGEFDNIIRACNHYGVEIKTEEDHYRIKLKKLKNLYDLIFYKSIDQISYELNIARKEAGMLLPAIVIFYSFVEFTQSSDIYIPKIHLTDGVTVSLRRIGDTDETLLENSYCEIVPSAWALAEKYRVSKHHAVHVSNLALSIFDQTRSIHGIEDRYRIFLKVAGILHDIGNFISLDSHSELSADIVRKENLLGFSDGDLDMLSHVIRYHSNENPSEDQLGSLSLENKILVSKLACMLKLAEAMDLGHNKRITKVKIKIDKDNLTIGLKTKHKLTLELWKVKKRSKFFEEIFGYNIDVKTIN